MSEALIGLLQAAVKRPCKLLFRDHLELRQLQGSRDREKFAKSALDRTKAEVSNFLEDHGVRITVDSEGSSQGEYCLINPIEGEENFIRGLPFFSLVLAVKKAAQGEACIMSFPALQKSIYAFEGGAWISDLLYQPSEQRLRAPRGSPFQHLQTICLDTFESIPKLPKLLRALNFGSGSYAAFCLFTNSLDACVLDSTCHALYRSVRLINKGYGGFLLEDESMRLILAGRPSAIIQALQRRGYKQVEDGNM